MLGKLLKYETKATSRVFLPLFGVLLVFAFINKLFMNFNMHGAWAIPQGISIAAYFILIVAIFVFTFVIMIQRFYKNLLSDEGYLMFTLPVKPWKHIVAKMLISMLWIILSVIVTALSIMIISYTSGVWADFFNELQWQYAMFIEELGFSPIGYFLECLLIMVIGIAASVLQIYASISLGHLSNRHKFLASFGAFLGINIVMQAIGSTLIYLAGRFGWMDWLSNMANPSAVHASLWLLIVGCLIEGIIYYIVVHKVLTKRLNLE